MMLRDLPEKAHLKKRKCRRKSRAPRGREEEHQAYEVHIELPEYNTKAWNRFERGPAAHAAASVKKGATQVVLQKLGPAMKEIFREASASEISS